MWNLVQFRHVFNMNDPWVKKETALCICVRVTLTKVRFCVLIILIYSKLVTFHCRCVFSLRCCLLNMKRTLQSQSVHIPNVAGTTHIRSCVCGLEERRFLQRSFEFTKHQNVRRRTIWTNSVLCSAVSRWTHTRQCNAPWLLLAHDGY